jgi:ATP-dependent Lon protease
MTDRIQVPALPDRIPVMPLRSTTVYPMGVIGVQIGMAPTLRLLAAHPEDNLLVALVIAAGEPDDPIEPGSLEKVAVLTRLSDRLNLPGGTVQATIQGLRRIRVDDVEESQGVFYGRCTEADETALAPAEADDLIARILTLLDVLAAEVDRISAEVPAILRMNVADPGRFADLVASLANFGAADKDEVLQRLDIRARLDFVLTTLNAQAERLRQVEEAQEPAAAPGKPGRKVDQATQIRQRIKKLQAQLGEVDPLERETIDLHRRLDAAELPPEAASTVRREIERLRAVAANSNDASEIRTYVDWALAMPWNSFATDGAAAIDLTRVEEQIASDLLLLEEPRERLLDYLAVAKLRGDLRGPIPCLVGPPDVGKTALVESLATGLGRPLARLELGGRGEIQLVGARRTRAGAQPGKIAGALRDVEVADPVFLLEEMDEIGLGKVEGDPIEAMEEVLAWDSVRHFVDRYLDLEFDVSNVLFIATAQDFYRVPRDLRELMVEIRIAGYTPEQKVEIARERLVPRLIAEHGIEPGDVALPDESLFHLARGYARDAGLGALRRVLSTLLRTRARAKARGETGTWTLDRDRIEEILGLPRYIATVAEQAPEVGVVTGLAWTAAGGELMFIEALRMPGSGRLIITGMLGDVMRESVNAAYSYVRSRGEALGITEEMFKDSDVHVHFPVGAIPKDGPSAGIAVTLAIASTLANRTVRHDIAMSGEVTLRGKVLEIGGVKEKVLAAHRAGLREVILPSGNERDLRDVPPNVRDSVAFHFVERMDEVLGLALLGGPRATAGRPQRAARPRKQAAADAAAKKEAEAAEGAQRRKPAEENAPRRRKTAAGKGRKG